MLINILYEKFYKKIVFPKRNDNIFVFYRFFYRYYDSVIGTIPDKCKII